MLPHFLIIGAAKSGTTWLRETLRAHPDVFMPEEELNFFSRHHHRGLAWYAAHFSATPAGALCGEHANTYLTDREVPARVVTALPDVKLLVVLRNPIERAYSAYCMQFSRGRVSADIERHLDPVRSDFPNLIRNVRYCEPLERWLGYVPRERLLLTLHEQIRHEPAALTNEIAEFLGLSRTTPLQPFNSVVNEKKAATAPLWLKQTLFPLVQNETIRKRVVGLARSVGIYDRIERRLARPLAYPRMTADLRERLSDYYGNEITALAAMLGRDLSHWREPSSEQNAPRSR